MAALFMENRAVHLDVAFECANGQNPRRLGENHLAVDTIGESSSYAGYFLVRVTNPTDQEQPCTLDIHNDPAIDYVPGDRRCFAAKPAPPVWTCRTGQSWRRVDDYERGDMMLRLTLRVPARGAVQVSPYVPLSYSEMSAWLAEQAATPAADDVQLHTLGHSLEGRPIELLSIGAADRPRILVVAGLHAVEFPGIWAVRGMIAYLTGTHPAARALRQHFRVDLLAHANPDGTVHGRSRTNLAGVDLHRQAAPDQPRAPEVQALWRWIRQQPPAIYINLHGWTACERGVEPFDGALRPHRDLYAAHGLGPLVDAADRLLTEQARPISRYERIEQFGGGYDAEDQNLLNQLARAYGTLAYVYEPNMRVGPAGCQQRGVEVLGALAQAHREHAPASRPA